MASAARVFDRANHGGSIVGPGVPTVLIAGMPAAVSTDLHVCVLSPDSHQPTTSPFNAGSSSVFIEGKPALRVGDVCICGASPLVGEPTVQIG